MTLFAHPEPSYRAKRDMSVLPVCEAKEEKITTESYLSSFELFHIPVVPAYGDEIRFFHNGFLLLLSGYLQNWW